MLLMILGACVRTPSTVSSPSKNSHVPTYPIRSCSYESSSQLWCFKPVSMNFLVLQYPFWKGTLRLPAIFTKTVQQEFMHWQNDFFCSVSHPTSSGIGVTVLTISDCWADEGFGKLRSLWHKQPQPVSELELLCSHLQYVAFLNSLCCCILLAYLGGCPTTLLLQQQSWSRETLGYFDLCANFFCVNWSPFQTGDAHTDPSPCPFCSGDTIHFFSCLCSPSPNYLSPQDNLFLAHDSDSDSTVWLCFPVPVISNLHSADRRGKIIFWGVRGNLWN